MNKWLTLESDKIKTTIQIKNISLIQLQENAVLVKTIDGNVYGSNFNTIE